jgi:hypothetical protein
MLNPAPDVLQFLVAGLQNPERTGVLACCLH